MPHKPLKTSTRVFGILLVCLAAAAVILFWRRPESGPAPVAVGPGGQAPVPAAVTEEVVTPLEPAPVIGPQAIEEDKDLEALMQERKARFGVENAVDFIAAADETIEVGEFVVPMREIIEKIRLKRGDILEDEIAGSRSRTEVQADLRVLEARIRDAEKRAQSRHPETRQRAMTELNDLIAQKERLERELAALEKEPDPDTPVALYGIYVVLPGDNIWNIHFNLLKELFQKRGISVSPLADEPAESGRSSGVGKLLKFSEHMVAIYNLRQRRLDPELDIITPDSKIVVFNCNRVFSMLDRIDYRNIHHIQYDGDTIWIPAVE